MSAPTDGDDEANRSAEDATPARSDADGRETAAPPDSLVPEPVTGGVTAELVRDAVGVARGDIPDRRFSETYGTAGDEDG